MNESRGAIEPSPDAAEADQHGRRELESARDRLLVELENERTKLRAFLMHLPVGAIVYEPPDFRIHLVNDAYSAIVGGRELVGKTPHEAFPEVPLAETLHHLLEVCRLKQLRVHHEHAVRLAGSEEDRYFTTTFQPLLDGAGQVSLIVATAVEVTAEVRARRSMVESVDRLRAILDEMPLGVSVRDPRTGEVILSNRASRSILGGEPMEGTAGDWQEWEPRYPDGRPMPREDFAFQKAIRTRQPVRNAITLLRKPEAEDDIVMRSSASLVRGQGGDDDLELVVTVFEDVTEEQRLLAEQEQTVRFAETFVGVLGHDLRNPLSSIILASALLERKDPALEEGDLKKVRQISSSAQRMRRMVEQLLDLTRGRLGGGIPVDCKPVDLVAVVSGVIDEIAEAHPAVMLHRDLPRQLPGVWDGDRLEQVASNLLGNAIEHGDVSRPITAELHSDGYEATFAVHSYGKPIPELTLPRLFDPFRRGPRSDRNKGLGLGLYITREIVLAHGGDVQVTSTAHEGTRFEVTLPLFPLERRSGDGGSMEAADGARERPELAKALDAGEVERRSTGTRARPE